MTDSVPHLTYFRFRGLGEPIRLLFEDLGVTYRDHRIGFDEWDALSPQMQFGQVPRLRIGDLELFQSQAILRYLARVHRLEGETDAARLRIDISTEAARDTQQVLWDHFWAPGSNAPAATREFETGRLAGSLRKLDAWLGDAPYFGGERPAFADYYALTVVDEAAAFFPAAVDLAPGLAAYRRRMAARPGVAAYIASSRQPEAYGFDPIRGERRPVEPAAG